MENRKEVQKEADSLLTLVYSSDVDEGKNKLHQMTEVLFKVIYVKRKFL